MIYDLTHKTSYRYANPVDLGQCVLRHQPPDRPGQRVVASVLSIAPQPHSVAHKIDFFGNRMAYVTFSGLHEQLEIEARSRVIVEPAVETPATPSWESVRSVAAMTANLDATSPVHFLHASRHAPLIAAARAFGALSTREQRPVLDLAIEISNRIHDGFVYDPKATDVATPILQTMSQRRGVCQDFAHVMIASLRALGLPAAYVSGYLRTSVPMGKPRLVGADASHAWVMVWCGWRAGWIGIDPTNRCLAGTDHIVLGIGRDYADISPVNGVFRTSGGHALKVSVDVIAV